MWPLRSKGALSAMRTGGREAESPFAVLPASTLPDTGNPPDPLWATRPAAVLPRRDVASRRAHRAHNVISSEEDRRTLHTITDQPTLRSPVGVDAKASLEAG